MTQPIYVLVSDLHGMWYTLQALLAKVDEHLKGAPYQVICLGDLVDRGPYSRQVVEWAMANKIPTAQGNHEHLCVDYHLNQLAGKKSDYQEGIWLMNGGIKCLTSWTGKPFERRSRLPRAAVAWMAALPLCIQLPEYPELCLSHTGHGLITKDSQHTAFDAVWSRSTEFPKDGLTRVYGHTPIKRIDTSGDAICIDTGAAYGGRLSTLLWPSRHVIDQVAID